MDLPDKNQAQNNNAKAIEQAAESWVQLCLYHIRQKKKLANQNKKAYEYSSK